MSGRRYNFRWMLVVYDLIVYSFVDFLFLCVFRSGAKALCDEAKAAQFLIGMVCIFTARFLAKIYRQIWRYANMRPYVYLIIGDFCGSLVYGAINMVLPHNYELAFMRLVAITAVNLVAAISMRMAYYTVYGFASRGTKSGVFIGKFVYLFTGVEIKTNDGEVDENSKRIKVAIIGAGRVGVTLAEELLGNLKAKYVPVCFIDISRDKIGRKISGLPVLSEDDVERPNFVKLGVQQVIFAVPQLDADAKKALYDLYKNKGYTSKVYDYLTMHNATGKRSLREFNAEELLFRQPIVLNDKTTSNYYNGKTVMITGGGGSIGSELCRQIANMNPKALIVLDVFENGAYEIQQELKIAYGDKLNLIVEIVSVCDREELEKVFAEHRPQVVLHAAAHKHVPLMERNCCEAVKNNVFGTLNTVELAEKYGTEKFIMVSTDKAVNPTNVMGATKRMCEMIVQCHSTLGSGTSFSATRFGNVLGSAGSVIPLFKKQIASGGPVTVTDKRIIRYFMTIPEASALVLKSGAIAKNGELFVLDMGKPVKILELAENMIKLSGFEPYTDIDIVETGLRPGEKLYEELLVRSEELDSTEDRMIFIERDTPIKYSEMQIKLAALSDAVKTNDNERARRALHNTVPTFRRPETVNVSVSE